MGTMNLTEPQAGSDVGGLSSGAVDNSDGTYAITGQKIYIPGITISPKTSVIWFWRAS